MGKYAFVAFLLLPLGLFAQDVPMMLQTKYHQGTPFNDATPGESVAGCGAVAVAQILKYYEQPAHGYGAMTYTYPQGEEDLTVDFENTLFDWDSILNEYRQGQYDEKQAKAVADLVFTCGAAMFSNYGSSTSVNNYAKMMYGLQHYLHMSPESRYLQRKYYTTAEWLEMLNANLKALHPVFYRGSWIFNGETIGHMFVIDGLNDYGEYHINFGHGNSQDKFADLEVINQSGNYPGGRPVCYNASQAMVVNCFPTPDYDAYPSQVCMSDAPVILNEDYRLNETIVNLGEKFKLSCKLRNVSQEAASIKFGWALVKNGEHIKQLAEKTYRLGAGNTFNQDVHIALALPEDLKSGNYELRLYSKSDIETEWQPVWDNAPSTVYVSVNDGMAHIVVPDNHQGNPNLYLAEEIKEVDTELSSMVTARSFLLHLINNTTNNFENTIRLDIKTYNDEVTFETVLPVYSQTKTKFHVAVPQSVVDLYGKNICSIKAFYYYDKEDRFIELGLTEPSLIENIKAEPSDAISIYDLNGMIIRTMRNSDVSTDYLPLLRSLPHGIYIIKEGEKTRKVVL